MKYTEKLNLKKPEEEDFISVSDYTDNMEIIDQAVTDASQKADDAASAAAGAATAARNAQAAAKGATGSAQSAIKAADEAKKVADANSTELKNKVPVEKGKGLSECNYTKEEKISWQESRQCREQTVKKTEKKDLYPHQRQMMQEVSYTPLEHGHQYGWSMLQQQDS